MGKTKLIRLEYLPTFVYETIYIYLIDIAKSGQLGFEVNVQRSTLNVEESGKDPVLLDACTCRMLRSMKKPDQEGLVMGLALL